MVYILLADGFEEAEALVPADLLRRADIDTALVSLWGSEAVGGRGIWVKADLNVAQVDLTKADMFVLPGGRVGVRNLAGEPVVAALLQEAADRDIWIAAICAAPTLLAKTGCLRGKRAVCYPGMEDQLIGAVPCPEEPVVVDGKLITARAADGLEATCIVRCRWTEETSPAPSEEPSAPPSQEPSGVDLAAFAQNVISTYELPSFLSLADSTLMDGFFPGLSAITSEQCLVYINQMSMNMGELVLVQVSSSSDVDAVKAILQARIDSMIQGGAWYPEPTEWWTNYSRVVSSGNYVMMVVDDDCDAIVSDFNALF